MRRSDTERRERQGVGWNVQENTRQQPNRSDSNCYALLSPPFPPFAWTEIPAMHISMHKHIHVHIIYTHAHKWTVQGMLTATAPYAPSVLRGNLRNGTVRNFIYLKQSFTFLLVKEFKLLLFCESSQHLRLIHQPTLPVCYPEPMLRLN